MAAKRRPLICFDAPRDVTQLKALYNKLAQKSGWYLVFFITKIAEKVNFWLLSVTIHRQKVEQRNLKKNYVDRCVMTSYFCYVISIDAVTIWLLNTISFYLFLMFVVSPCNASTLCTRHSRPRAKKYNFSPTKQARRPFFEHLFAVFSFRRH